MEVTNSSNEILAQIIKNSSKGINRCTYFAGDTGDAIEPLTNKLEELGFDVFATGDGWLEITW